MHTAYYNREEMENGREEERRGTRKRGGRKGEEEEARKRRLRTWRRKYRDSLQNPLIVKTARNRTALRLAWLCPRTISASVAP